MWRSFFRRCCFGLSFEELADREAAPGSVTFYSGERKNLAHVGVKIASYGVKEGTMAIVISLLKNKGY